MPEVSTISQVIQMGPETVLGTQVAATKIMSGMMFAVDPVVPVDEFKPSGFKYDTVTVPNRDQVAVTVAGVPTYTEMIYPLHSIFGVGTPTTPSGGTATRLWTFNPNVNTEDVPKSFTVEMGSTSNRARKWGYGVFTGIGFTFDNVGKSALNGTMIGQSLQDGITMTGSLSAISLQPLVGKQIDVFYDLTSVALGTTKLGRVLSGEFSITGKYGPLYVVDSSKTSFAVHVELAPVTRLKLKVEADVNGMQLFQDAKTGVTKFIRLNALGANIENPTIAAPAAVAGAAGTPNGTYKLNVTYVTALGETAGGTEQTLAVTSTHITWQSIPLGPAGTTGRSLYRTQPAGLTGTERKISTGAAATIADNTTTTFDDNIADATLLTNNAVPTLNTSGLLNYQLTFDMAAKIVNVAPFADQNGVYALDFEAAVVFDAGWGFAIKPSVQNALTSL